MEGRTKDGRKNKQWGSEMKVSHLCDKGISGNGLPVLTAGICNSGLFTFAELFAILYSMVSSSVAEASRSSTLQMAVCGVSGGQRTQRHFSGQLQLQHYSRRRVVINSQREQRLAPDSRRAPPPPHPTPHPTTSPALPAPFLINRKRFLWTLSRNKSVNQRSLKILSVLLHVSAPVR